MIFDVEHYLPNRKLLTPYFLPDVELPEGEQFTVTNEFQASAYQAMDWAYSFQHPWLLCSLAGLDSDPAGFLLQIVHHTRQGRRQLFHRPTPAAAVLGTGALPLPSRRPYLVDAGESLSIEIRNLSAVATAAAPSNIWVALHGLSLLREAS